MTIFCLFLSCTWGNPHYWTSLGERLVTHTCRRCGSTKTEVV